MKTRRIRRLKVADGRRLGLLGNYPSISITGSVTGMRKLYWGNLALVVRCGQYYYNVQSNPDIYEVAR